ncbi:recombinase family protein [Burkholderia ubonensis]|uniref:recombinase family protein n=1 Tax=Burkholderia ubonensis TaxID=101571 RepID=UPI0008FD9CCD|nr:recombinase family protein [Burkholderia ubonensis]
MRVGYARVSTNEQSLSLQIDALTQAGCKMFFSDHGVPGSNFRRPGLDSALARLSAGDTLVVWRLDRLGRSLGKLVELITHLESRKVHFHSMCESIDTNSASGILIFHVIAALAEFEQRLISERTRAGIAASRARGGRIGRKPALTDEQCNLALTLLKTRSIHDVAKMFNVHPRTLKRIEAASQIRTVG